MGDCDELKDGAASTMDVVLKHYAVDGFAKELYVSDFNPYEFRPAELGEDAEQEMFDHEARVRIANALHVSHFPIVCFAILMVLIGVVVAVLALFAFVMSARDIRWYALGDVVISLIFSLTLATGFLCAASWLWSCAVTIDRARKRLTIASVATAVEAQSTFWRKSGRLLLIIMVIDIAVIVLANLISAW